MVYPDSELSPRAKDAPSPSKVEPRPYEEEGYAYQYRKEGREDAEVESSAPVRAREPRLHIGALLRAIPLGLSDAYESIGVGAKLSVPVLRLDEYFDVLEGGRERLSFARVLPILTRDREQERIDRIHDGILWGGISGADVIVASFQSISYRWLIGKKPIALIVTSKGIGRVVIDLKEGDAFLRCPKKVIIPIR
jgi:hypothetical protein